MAKQVPNVCAGPFGSFYDFYIERPWLVRIIGHAIWGIDGSVLYESMEPIAQAPAGATIADVPCGGGVALRALRPEQDVRYLAGDLSPKMVKRAERRARARSLRQVEPQIARCLKPGGRLIGTTFFSGASLRARALFRIGSYSGHPLPPSREALGGWLEAAGFEQPEIGPQPGFATFEGRKPAS